MERLRWLSLPVISAILASATGGQTIDRSKLIDLTYSFNDKTIYWPNAKGFRHQKDGWNVTARFTSGKEWRRSIGFPCRSWSHRRWWWT
jgi:hypothetical protein